MNVSFRLAKSDDLGLLLKLTQEYYALDRHPYVRLLKVLPAILRGEPFGSLKLKELRLAIWCLASVTAWNMAASMLFWMRFIYAKLSGERESGKGQ